MPVTLAQLVGQSVASRRLSTMVSRGRLAHALLFMGPQGVGKLAAARILAQILMCTDRRPEEITACDECSACHKVKENLHADVHWLIAGAKALKVDPVRDAMRELQLRPMEARVKLLIIDGAERMTVEAQSALLKTLEEPPGASHIILSTSRPRILLPTVLSRCQRVPFVPIPRAQIARVMVEQKSMSETEASMVAAIAEGSLSRALAIDVPALLEQRDRIAEVDRVLAPRSGPGPGPQAERAAAAGRGGGSEDSFRAYPAGGYGALEVARQISEERDDLHAALDALTIWLHDQILLAAGRDPSEVTHVDRLDDLQKLAEARGLSTLLERLEIVAHAKRQLELPYNLNPLMIAEQLCFGLAGLLRPPRPEDRPRQTP